MARSIPGLIIRDAESGLMVMNRKIGRKMPKSEQRRLMEQMRAERALIQQPELEPLPF